MPPPFENRYPQLPHKQSPKALQVPDVDSQFRTKMEGYWATNSGSAEPVVVWDAFKAFSRGHYQTIMANVRKERRSALTKAESVAAIQGTLYVGSHDPQHYIRQQSLTREFLSLRTSLTQKKLLAQSQTNI